jgi:hypothetical protein
MKKFNFMTKLVLTVVALSGASLLNPDSLTTGQELVKEASARPSYTTSVTVYKNGKPAKNKRVVLHFKCKITGCDGSTEAVYTDSNGVAIISHRPTGTVKVFVDRRDTGYTGKAPGSIYVNL